MTYFYQIILKLKILIISVQNFVFILKVKNSYYLIVHSFFFSFSIVKIGVIAALTSKKCLGELILGTSIS